MLDIIFVGVAHTTRALSSLCSNPNSVQNVNPLKLGVFQLLED